LPRRRVFLETQLPTIRASRKLANPVCKFL
jgi:hypothetical protein